MNTKRRAHCQLWHDWKERIIRIGDEQTSLQNQFDNLRNEFTDNSPRIEALEAGVNALDGRLIIAEGDIADAEDRITACEADIDRIDAELVDKTGEINNLANRMSLAEADIDNLDARLEGIETGEILLSQLVPDADKDMAGKALNNVKINANEVTVRGSQIDPTRINNDIVLWDLTESINSGNIELKEGSYTINQETDPSVPFSKSIKTTDYASTSDSNPVITVKPGERIYGEFWVKTDPDNTGNTRVNLGYRTVRQDGSISIYRFIVDEADIPPGTEWTKITGSTKFPSDTYAIIPRLLINYTTPGQLTYVANVRIWRDANFDSDLTAKIISADGVVIKDGGTVDGVDISTHTHDGTAVGGQKISYNDLVDKPDVAVATHNHDGTTVGGPKISYNNLADKPELDVATHNHDGSPIGGPRIALSNIVPDADKDMSGIRIQNLVWKATTPEVVKPPEEYNSPDGCIFFENYMDYMLNPDFPYHITPTITIGDARTGTGFRRQIVFSRDQVYFRHGGVQPPGWQPWKKFMFTDMNNVASLSGLVITGGGTVDGVDISTHTHDGTAVGGQKISYNDLVDKPTISRPPVPFRKKITITELAAGDYVMLDILPPGRSSIMLTRIIVHSFARSGTAWIDPSFIADDDTETTMIAGIQNTDEKGFDKLMPITDMSSKNAIKNIKFGVYGTGTVTADLTCYGYIY